MYNSFTFLLWGTLIRLYIKTLKKLEALYPPLNFPTHLCFYFTLQKIQNSKILHAFILPQFLHKVTAWIHRLHTIFGARILSWVQDDCFLFCSFRNWWYCRCSWSHHSSLLQIVDRKGGRIISTRLHLSYAHRKVTHQLISLSHHTMPNSQWEEVL